MWTAEKMNRVSVIVLKDDLEGVMEEIARLGILHPVRVEEIDRWAEDLAAVGVESAAAEYAKRQRRLRQLFEGLPSKRAANRPTPVQEIRRMELGEIDTALDGIEARLQPVLSAQAELVHRKNEFTARLGQLEVLVPAGVPLKDLMHSTFLAGMVGQIHESQVPILQQLLSAIPAVVFPYRKNGASVHVVCVVLRRDKDTLEACLRKVGFVEAALPQDLRQVSAEVEASVARESAALDTELARVSNDLERMQAAILPDLLTAWFNIEAGLLLLRVEDFCKSTEKTCLFAGWAPREQTDRFVAAIRERTQGRAIVEVESAETLEAREQSNLNVPVQIKLPQSLRPFRILVQGFGTPTYRMIDPTLFVAITFLVMFGMMFGDVGHGLVFMAIGVLVARKVAEFRDIGKLMVYCGVSSVVFGVLYGSVFGVETLIPALWVRPLDGVSTLFKTAIGFGVLVVSLGLVLNMINAVRTGTISRGVFDESGLLVALAYWAGVGVTVRYLLSSGGAFQLGPALAIVGVPLLLFLAKGPILRLAGQQAKAFPEGVVNYLVEGLVEIMDVLMGFLANTVSFIRVAAFGLAHAGLFVAIFGIADAVAEGPGGRVTYGLVLVAGNIIVIALEGLVVTIQAVRLEYYEFFGKFFKGSGAKYDPVAFSGISPD